MEKLKDIAFPFKLVSLIEVALIFFLGTVGCILFNFVLPGKDLQNLGVRIVKAMYEFDDLHELSNNYTGLAVICSDDVWKQITLDNDSRVISTYYKFQASKSEVEVIKAEDNFVIYRLHNEYISPSRLFILYYEYSGNTVTSIREYELEGLSYGDTGAIDLS